MAAEHRLWLGDFLIRGIRAIHGQVLLHWSGWGIVLLPGPMARPFRVFRVFRGPSALVRIPLTARATALRARLPRAVSG